MYSALYFDHSWSENPQAHSKPRETSRIELFAKINNEWKLLSIFSSIFDVWLGSECISVKIIEMNTIQNELKSKWKLPGCLNNQNHTIKILSSFCHIRRFRRITCNCDDRKVWTRNFLRVRVVKVLLQNHLWLLIFGIQRNLLLWLLFYSFNCLHITNRTNPNVTLYNL